MMSVVVKTTHQAFVSSFRREGRVSLPAPLMVGWHHFTAFPAHVLRAVEVLVSVGTSRRCSEVLVPHWLCRIVQWVATSSD